MRWSSFAYSSDAQSNRPFKRVLQRSHLITLLPNKRILVAGGQNNTGVLASAELYDPASGKWTATGSMKTARYGAYVVDWLSNGQILVAGGQNNSGAVTSKELYDPSTGEWTLRTP